MSRSRDDLNQALTMLVLVLIGMVIIMFVATFTELKDFLESWLKSHTD